LNENKIDRIVGNELDAYLRKTYKISLAEYERIGMGQGWCCAICGEKPERRLLVDHEHGSKKVRGLLCNFCNLGIGHLRDNPARCRAAAEYLEYHE
jgi:hypothetical protein